MKTAEQNFVLFLDHVNAHVDRVLRDKGMSNKEIHDAIVSTPMPEFFDQQNKELREQLIFSPVCACKVSDTPCGPNCTCKNPVMSGGCLNCATYGNDEQRKKMAENIQQRLSEIQRLTNSYNTCAENFAALQVRFGEEVAKVNSLTKEVEELKDENDKIGQELFDRDEENMELENTITRLRELLGRAGSMMSTVKHFEVLEAIDKVKYDELLTEIDQTLKP